MKNLWREGNFEILSDDVGGLPPKEMHLLIKRCGTVSHQSWKSSKKSPEEFIRMIWRVKHYSVLEHSWFSFFIPSNSEAEKGQIELDLKRGNGLFCITSRANGVLVSGNARIYIEAYLRNPTTTTATLLHFLQNRDPLLFPPELFKVRRDLVIPYDFIFNPSLKTKKEILVHRAMTVLFSNVSRGFTHEDVRSRNGHNKIASYTQRSTRYVDPLKKESFNFILPYTPKLPETLQIAEEAYSLQEILIFFAQLYRSARNSGLRPEEARQWLPIGIETEIAQTMNLSEWLHWFIIRTQKAAHPEIRFLACNLLREIQKRIPGIFEKFEFHKDKAQIFYTEFIPSDDKNSLLY